MLNMWYLTPSGTVRQIPVMPSEYMNMVHAYTNPASQSTESLFTGCDIFETEEQALRYGIQKAVDRKKVLRVDYRHWEDIQRALVARLGEVKMEQGDLRTHLP
jgi:hypothetical protein